MLGENIFDEKPDNLTDEEYNQFLDFVEIRVDVLKNRGWDEAAIEAYKDTLSIRIKVSGCDDFSQYIEEANLLNEDTNKVGSGVYTLMYNACEYSDKEKVDMVIEQMGGKIDSNGMLQLTGTCKFDPDMSPNSDFLSDFADSVYNAYGENGLDSKEAHQLRYYIDKNNIEYIRDNYKEPGMTDEQALAAFTEAEVEGGYLDAEPGRLHNKFPANTTYYDYYSLGEQNRKRLTPNFHSEFIVDSDGNFVTQWNVLEIDDNGRIISDAEYYYNKYNSEDDLKYTWEEARLQVANTESFNYGKEIGDYHDRLDVNTVSQYDPEYRESIIAGMDGDVALIKPESGLPAYLQMFEINDGYSKWMN